MDPNSPPPTPLEALRELLGRMCAGQATPTDIAQIEQLASTSSDARQLYIEYMRLAADLRVGASEGRIVDDVIAKAVIASQAESARSESLPPATSAGATTGPIFDFLPTWPKMMLAVLALALMLPAIRLLTPRPAAHQNDATSEPAELAQAERSSVGAVTRLADADWTRGSQVSPRLTGRLAIGDRIELTKGLAEVTYDTGAKVVLEGPVEFEVTSFNGGRLFRGKVAAEVPPQAIGFFVQTPQGNIVDLGTEFCAAVDGDDRAEVHVLQGEVELWTGQSQTQVVSVEGLRTGESVAWTPNGELTRLTAESVSFTTPSKFPSPRGIGRWRQYSDAIAEDRDLIAYYRFERDEATPSRLANEASATRSRFDGVLGDGESRATVPAWDAGRWPGKSALRFNGVSWQQVRIAHDSHVDVAGGSVSVAAWVKPMSPLKSSVILSKRSLRAVALQFAVIGSASDPPNRIQFLTENHHDLVRHYSDPALQRWDGSWTFVAATFDVATRFTRFYIDGLPVGVRDGVGPVCPMGEDWVIGTAPHETGAAEQVQFQGLMDELALFRRVLAPAEIRQMYEAGRPE